MHDYSPFFQTLYDEQNPVGALGRGTHYSILRAMVFHDENGQPLAPDTKSNTRALFHDFAIIWDEDHDTRVIEAIYKIYADGLLSCFSFLGERKGGLTALTRAGKNHFDHFASDRIEQCCSDIYGDYWTSTIGNINDPQGIINDSTESVVLYLRNIDMLWRLGAKPISYIRQESF